jgi:SAM-dependent methyltransferase
VTRSDPSRADNTIHPGVAHPARYDQVADRYVAEVRDRLDDEGTAALLELLGDVVDRRLLDIACGHGRVSRELARRGASVTGLDLSAELVQHARTDTQIPGNEIHYEVADICDSDVLAGSKFDGIVCNFGASDIDDLNGMLRSVRRLLSPGGRVLRTVPPAPVLSRMARPGTQRVAARCWLLPRRLVADVCAQLTDPKRCRCEPPNAIHVPDCRGRPRPRSGIRPGTRTASGMGGRRT